MQGSHQYDHLFQPLDLTVNNHCKIFIKTSLVKQVITSLQNKYKNLLKLYLKVDEINICIRLTTTKPLHAHCLVEF